MLPAVAAHKSFEKQGNPWELSLNANFKYANTNFR
jgi:hypothetical protein